MKLSRIELSFQLENAGCFISSVLKGSLKDPIIVLKLSDGKELPMLEQDLICAIGQLETVLEHLGTLRGDIKDRGVSVEEINQALLSNTVNIGASGLAKPHREDTILFCASYGEETADGNLCCYCADEMVESHENIDNVVARALEIIDGRMEPTTLASTFERFREAISVNNDAGIYSIKQELENGANRLLAACRGGDIALVQAEVSTEQCSNCLGCGSLPGKVVREVRLGQKIKAIRTLRDWCSDNEKVFPGIMEAKQIIEAWMDKWAAAGVS